MGMAGEQLQVYLTALASSLTVGVVIPLFILLGIAAAIWWLIAKAQEADGFDISDVLRDESGKISSERLLTFSCFGVSSWVMAVIVFALPNLVVEAYAIYMGFWSATATAKEFAKRKWPTTVSS
jgi:hypothetical protein